MFPRVLAAVLCLGCAGVQFAAAAWQSHLTVLVSAVFAFAACFVLLFLDRIVLVSRGPFCTKCEYDLSVVEGSVCPECGTERPKAHA
jgi:hypothetical protein